MRPAGSPANHVLPEPRLVLKHRALDQLATCSARRTGGVAEWSNAAVSKTVIGASLSRVRIPPPPPVFSYNVLFLCNILKG